MDHWLVINGLENAFPKEFGCSCARCVRTERTANTSASLITTDDEGNTRHHLLFDCGGGVADSLAQHDLLRGSRARLDGVILTHWHTDHSIDVRRLLTGWERSRRRSGATVTKVPLWCREGSAAWLWKEQPYAMSALAQPVVCAGSQPAGTVLEPVSFANAGVNVGVSVTPITMYHASADVSVPNTLDEPSLHVPCCAGFVITTPRAKTVLCWDMDATNDWVLQPDNLAVMLARDADTLLIDCNTWRVEHMAAGRTTGHASFQTVCRYVTALRPRRTVLMHLSGHEDAVGDGFGWTDAEWQARASHEWRTRDLPGSVVVPRIGQMFAV